MNILKNTLVLVITLIKVIVMFPIPIVLKLIGFIVIPIALPFGTVHANTLNKNGWMLKTLPKWAWLWDNKIDGCYGDPEGNWAFNDLGCKTFRKARTFGAQWRWMAWRNAVHGLIDTSLYSADLSKLPLGQRHPRYFGTKDVENRYRQDGSVREGFLCCWVKKGWYFRSEVYFIKRWFGSNRCLRIRLGYKVLPHYTRHFGVVGYTNSLQPAKKILPYGR